MKTIQINTKLFFGLMAVTFTLLNASQLYAQFSVEESNKKIIEKGFEQWAKGIGNLFPLVADNVKWTIEGYNQPENPYVSSSKTFNSKKQLMEQGGTAALYAKLDGIIKPEVIGIYADRDMVIAYWKGHATTTDGKPFANTYAWFMRMKDGKITELTAFLDMAVMKNVLTNVPDKK